MAELHPARLAALTEAMVVLQRYTLDITTIARRALGPDGGDNRDIQVLLALHRLGPCSVTALQDALGIPRSTLGRAVRALSRAGLVEGRDDPDDLRRVVLGVTNGGRQRVSDFDVALGAYFVAARPQLTWALGLLRTKAAAPAPGRRARTALEAAEAMGRAGAGYVADVATALLPLGIRSDDRYAVFLLYAQPGLRPSALAADLGWTRSRTSGLLRRLEEARLVEGSPAGPDEDGRGVSLLLTEKGHAAVATMLGVLDQHAESIGAALALTLP